MTVDVRPLAATDIAAADALFAAELGGRMQARGGEVHDVLALPGFGAWSGEDLVGAATHGSAVEGGRVELAAIAVKSGWRVGGVGTALVDAVVAAAARLGATELWLVTTNDNLDALRFYQRRDFRVEQIDTGAVDRARDTLKSTLPLQGEYGIPMHDEVVLVRTI